MTSSMVVTPSATLNQPNWRSGTIPSVTAAGRSSPDCLRCIIKLLHARSEGADFKNRRPALVAGVPAALASAGLHDLRGVFEREADLLQIFLRIAGRVLAIRAQHAHQPLRDERPHRCGDQERLHAHVDEARDAADGVVRVQRAEHQVPRERGADRDFRGLEVAHFADHDHVRVAAQDAAERGGKGKVDLRLDRNLDHAGELVFHRVLDGHDAPLAGVERGEKRVERG